MYCKILWLICIILVNVLQNFRADLHYSKFACHWMVVASICAMYWSSLSEYLRTVFIGHMGTNLGLKECSITTNTKFYLHNRFAQNHGSLPGHLRAVLMCYFSKYNVVCSEKNSGRNICAPLITPQDMNCVSVRHPINNYFSF